MNNFFRNDNKDKHIPRPILYSEEEIDKEISNILDWIDNKDENVISLNDVAFLLQEKFNTFDYTNMESLTRLIYPINSYLDVYIWNHNIMVYSKISPNSNNIFGIYKTDFGFTLECRYDFIKEKFKGLEKEILNNIYIRINKLPICLQEELYTLRKKRLKEGKHKNDKCKKKSRKYN